MTNDLIKQARELLEKCSEGPWSRNFRINGDCSYKIRDGHGIDLQTHFDGGLFPGDCDFIAFARNNMAAILDDLESKTNETNELIVALCQGQTLVAELRDDIERLRDALKFYADKKHFEESDARHPCHIDMICTEDGSIARQVLKGLI